MEVRGTHPAQLLRNFHYIPPCSHAYFITTHRGVLHKVKQLQGRYSHGSVRAHDLLKPRQSHVEPNQPRYADIIKHTWRDWNPPPRGGKGQPLMGNCLPPLGPQVPPIGGLLLIVGTLCPGPHLDLDGFLHSPPGPRPRNPDLGIYRDYWSRLPGVNFRFRYRFGKPWKRPFQQDQPLEIWWSVQ
jgi:hypothetical protein